MDASDIPARAAHVTHALMEAWTAADGSGPLLAAEVCEYDSEALTVQSTGVALTQARRLGLVGCVPDGPGGVGLWWATDRAWEIRRALEDRFLTEVG